MTALLQNGHNYVCAVFFDAMASGYCGDPLVTASLRRPDGNLHRETRPREVTPLQPHIHMRSSQLDLPPNSFEDIISGYRCLFGKPGMKLLQA